VTASDPTPDREPVDVAEIRKRHRPERHLITSGEFCRVCPDDFPCLPIRLANEVERLREASCVAGPHTHAGLCAITTAREERDAAKALVRTLSVALVAAEGALEAAPDTWCSYCSRCGEPQGSGCEAVGEPCVDRAQRQYDTEAIIAAALAKARTAQGGQ
jgi:hypothetical protein